MSNWFDLAIAAAIFGMIYVLPKLIERYVSISLGITALLKGASNPPEKKTK